MCIYKCQDKVSMGIFFFKDVTFSKEGTAESVISGSPKTLSGLTTTGWGCVGQPWSLQAQHLRGRLYIPDSQWRVCGSKLFFLSGAAWVTTDRILISSFTDL